jgi:hypothetical protein
LVRSLYQSVKKIIFEAADIFATNFFNATRLLLMANLILNCDPETKTPRPFSNGVTGNFSRMFNFSTQFQLVCFSSAESVSCTKSTIFLIRCKK